MSETQEVIELMEEILDDNTVPRNIKNKIQEIISTLQEHQELSLKVNKALNLLDEISDDNNIQPYTRTQIWNVASMLESL